MAALERLSAPSMSRMPALSGSSTTGGSSTGPSSISSALCTPDDDPYLESLNDFFAKTPKHCHDGITTKALYEDDCLQPTHLMDPPTSKTISLSRVVARAKRLGKTFGIRKTPRKFGTRASGISVHITQNVHCDTADDTLHSPNVSVDRLAREARSSSYISERETQFELAQQADPFDVDVDDDDFIPQEFLSYLRGPWTRRRLIHSSLRLILFLPWCVAVGGAIVLSPDRLETIAFTPGYMDSERGTRRFRYWAHCAGPHICIFLAFLAVTFWWNAFAGAITAGAVAAKAVYVWGDFQFDSSIPLGHDDKQSVYLAVFKAYTEEGFILHVDDVSITTGEQAD
ncbi:predicted protein [Postia placenta Mad-698-R]|nr:predicted protein [Postia placenta Mad-698-R]